jgi:hypothetical protein
MAAQIKIIWMIQIICIETATSAVQVIWTALWRGDKNPSLKMAEGAGGKLLLECFAGCV